MAVIKEMDVNKIYVGQQREPIRKRFSLPESLNNEKKLL